jgi:hypothetical protein
LARLTELAWTDDQVAIVKFNMAENAQKVVFGVREFPLKFGTDTLEGQFYSVR